VANEAPGRDGENEAPAVPALALPPKQAARALGIGERLLWTKTNDGTIPCLKLGSRTLYPVAALQRWLDEQAENCRGARR
jgi:predicted DNA-binding transcriptional regulator AlpA